MWPDRVNLRMLDEKAGGCEDIFLGLRKANEARAAWARQKARDREYRSAAAACLPKKSDMA
jgi:hypothetical protein